MSTEKPSQSVQIAPLALAAVIRDSGGEYLEGDQPAMLAELVAKMSAEELAEGTELTIRVRHGERELAHIELSPELALLDVTLSDFAEPEPPPFSFDGEDDR